MSELGDKIRALASTRTTPEWEWSSRGAVGRSPDFERVVCLPRRNSENDVALTLTQTLTDNLRRPEGTMSLRPLQARALSEAVSQGGLFAPMGVGTGKTLVCLLLPTVLQAHRAVLVIPPRLKAQLKKMYAEYAEHWTLPRLVETKNFCESDTATLYIVTYSELSTERTAHVLEQIRPDVVICDEAHQVGRWAAKRTKVFRRYVRSARRAGHLKALAMASGTVLRKSFRDVAQMMGLVLGSGSPAPLEWNEVEAWAAALDPSDFPAPAGVLEELIEGDEDFHEAVRRRITETPGVVASGENELGVALIIAPKKVKVPASVTKALRDLRKTWCTPGGEEITDAMSFSRYARQLALGLYYRRTWPRGEPLEVRNAWLEARRNWHREVRQYLTHQAGPGLDSPGLLALAARQGDWDSEHYAAWKAVEKTAVPETEVVWIDDFLVQDAVAWSRKNTGIIWYDNVALGERIAQAGGFPRYGGGQKASEEILNETGDRTIVVSANALIEGLNLQCFSTQLVTCITSAVEMEQLLGRTHRPGQLADEVECWVYLHTIELQDALEAIRRDAHFIQRTLGSQQKLAYATYATE